MTKLLRALFVPVLGLATLLPAQDDKAKGQEPKAQEPKAQEPKAEAKPEAKPAPAADDAATAADKAVKAVDAFLAEKKLDKSNARWRNLLPKFPALEFDANSDYFWHMETDAGAVKIRFYADTAPNHVANGIYLARAGFYDGPPGQRAKRIAAAIGVAYLAYFTSAALRGGSGACAQGKQGEQRGRAGTWKRAQGLTVLENKVHRRLVRLDLADHVAARELVALLLGPARDLARGHCRRERRHRHDGRGGARKQRAGGEGARRAARRAGEHSGDETLSAERGQERHLLCVGTSYSRVVYCNASASTPTSRFDGRDDLPCAIARTKSYETQRGSTVGLVSLRLVLTRDLVPST